MAMQPTSPQDDHRPKQLMRRLDRATRQINPFLFAVAVGLVVLYVTCLIALMIRLPAVHLNACVATSEQSESSQVQQK
jgi:hypothetical protein